MIPFLLSPIGKRIGAVLAIVFMLWAGYQYAYGRGHSDGVPDGKREALEIDRKSFEQERDEFKKSLVALQSQVQAKDMIVQQATQNAVVLRDALRSIPRSIPASATEPPKDSADKLADYDALFSENEKRKQIEVQLDNTIQALKDENLLVAKQRDVAIQFGNDMVKHYTVAYSAAQKKHSRLVKILSLGLIKDKKLDLPDPISLKVQP